MGSFDSAAFFASEESCSAQDDREMHRSFASLRMTE
jgi:hypothetical protein